MAYYTIAHIIQGPENYKGLKEGPEHVKPEQMTDQVMPGSLSDWFCFRRFCLFVG
jgi:hypothetical protein